MTKINDLTQGSISKGIWSMAIPLITASFVQMAYNMTDMIWLGHLGSESVAAVGVAGFFTWLGNALSFISKVGAEVTISQSLGARARIRGSLSQTAQGRVFDHAAEVFQCLKIFHGSLTLRDFIQGFVQAFVADTTRCTFTAGFFHCEFKIEFGNRYHTVVFVHHAGRYTKYKPSHFLSFR